VPVAKKVTKKAKPVAKASSSVKKPAKPAKSARPATKPSAPAKKAARPDIKVKAAAKPARRVVDNSPKPGSGPGPVIMSPKRSRAFVNPPPPLAPVPTNGKPKKNQAGLSSKELEHFRELLLDKRRELVGDMSHMEREALRSASGTNLSNLPMHMADMGTDNYEQEFTLGLVEKERVLLREINQALAKIQDGTYGICEGTGKPINKVRLEAQPWARFSIEYARQMERGFIRH
jgi:DnaK suppressor protein